MKISGKTLFLLQLQNHPLKNSRCKISKRANALEPVTIWNILLPPTTKNQNFQNFKQPPFCDGKKSAEQT